VLSGFAFNFNLRRYSTRAARPPPPSIARAPHDWFVYWDEDGSGELEQEEAGTQNTLRHVLATSATTIHHVTPHATRRKRCKASSLVSHFMRWHGEHDAAGTIYRWCGR
jgi:hypothetical protein